MKRCLSCWKSDCYSQDTDHLRRINEEVVHLREEIVSHEIEGQNFEQEIVQLQKQVYNTIDSLYVIISFSRFLKVSRKMKNSKASLLTFKLNLNSP